MGLYSAGFTTVAAAANAAYAEFRMPATGRARIREIGLTTRAATASGLSIYRTATPGTATTTVLGQPMDDADPAAVGVVATAWSTAPSITGIVPLRRWMAGAAVGAGLLWTWNPGEFVVGSTAGVRSFTITNTAAAAGSILDGYIMWEE